MNNTEVAIIGIKNPREKTGDSGETSSSAYDIALDMVKECEVETKNESVVNYLNAIAIEITHSD